MLVLVLANIRIVSGCINVIFADKSTRNGYFCEPEESRATPQTETRPGGWVREGGAISHHCVYYHSSLLSYLLLSFHFSLFTFHFSLLSSLLSYPLAPTFAVVSEPHKRCGHKTNERSSVHCAAQRLSCALQVSADLYRSCEMCVCVRVCECVRSCM